MSTCGTSYGGRAHALIRFCRGLSKNSQRLDKQWASEPSPLYCASLENLARALPVAVSADASMSAGSFDPSLADV